MPERISWELELALSVGLKPGEFYDVRAVRGAICVLGTWERVWGTRGLICIGGKARFFYWRRMNAYWLAGNFFVVINDYILVRDNVNQLQSICVIQNLGSTKFAEKFGSLRKHIF